MTASRPSAGYTTCVVPCGRGPENFDVYIGGPCKMMKDRGHTEFPYRNFYYSTFPGHKNHKTPAEALVLYEKHIRASKELWKSLHKLADKRLGCWCLGDDPVCHGPTLIRLIHERAGVHLLEKHRMASRGFATQDARHLFKLQGIDAKKRKVSTDSSTPEDSGVSSRYRTKYSTPLPVLASLIVHSRTIEQFLRWRATCDAARTLCTGATSFLFLRNVFAEGSYRWTLHDSVEKEVSVRVDTSWFGETPALDPSLHDAPVPHGILDAKADSSADFYPSWTVETWRLGRPIRTPPLKIRWARDPELRANTWNAKVGRERALFHEASVGLIRGAKETPDGNTLEEILSRSGQANLFESYAKRIVRHWSSLLDNGYDVEDATETTDGISLVAPTESFDGTEELLENGFYWFDLQLMMVLTESKREIVWKIERAQSIATESDLTPEMRLLIAIEF